MITKVRRPRLSAPVEGRLSSFGKSSPLGATCVERGVNFSLYSRTASHVEILIFDHEDAPKPTPIACTAHRIRRAACGSTRIKCSSIRTAVLR
jgi:pullulanase/glycogen debranching enzyme